VAARDDGDDRALVQELVRGDAGAWATFVERQGPVVLALVRRALHARGIRAGEADVDDLVSEVFTAFLERERALLRSFRFECSLRSWLAIVTQGRIGRWLRARKKTASLDEALLAEASDEQPIEAAAESELHARLKAAIETLPERDRVALRLFYEEHLSREEIGKVLGTSAAHTGVILDRARRKVRGIET
jgi:RNA polymerase sigma-70 factor (ECF subfamily)